MKPQTILQKQVIQLSSKLKPITEEQEQWAYTHCLDKYAFRSRKTLFCLECGSSWREEGSLAASIIDADCPKCGSHLKLRESLHRDSAYLSILATHKGMQVERMFYVVKDFKKNQRAQCWLSEVMQHWVDPSGSITTLTKNVNGLSHYYDQWIFHSELEVRSNSYKFSLRCDIAPFKIHPERRILPLLKRNGFKGYFYDFTPHRLFSTILRKPIAETLLKAGQIPMLQLYAKSSSNVENYWSSIKICIRNGYVINDPSTWEDYIDLLKHFGKDIHNPKYTCPENLVKAHDILVKKKRYLDNRKKLIELKEQMEIDQQLYSEQKGKFLDLRFCKGNITVKPLATVKEFMEEGSDLNHCLFTNAYHKKAKSLIMSARIDNKPIETIEFSLSDMSVIQARGQNNKASKYHNAILSLIQKNIPQIAARL